MLVEKLLKFALLGSSWVMYLLLALSVVSISTMIERWFFFRKQRDDVDELADQLYEAVEREDNEAAETLVRAHRSLEARVLEPALRYLDGGVEALCHAIDSSMITQRKALERGTTMLGTLGNNAPFIGLFGTVIGVIIAFQQLGSSQSNASMSSVMGGIAEALVATGVGLFVAIPAVVGYNIIDKRIRDVEDNVSSLSKGLCARLSAESTRARALRDSEPAQRSVQPSGITRRAVAQDGTAG